MTDYQILCASFWSLMNLLVVGFLTYVGWSIVKFADFRKHILQSAQDGDNVTHWSDGKNVISLILGLFSAWFTGNLVLLFVYNKMFELGPMGVIGTFIAVTFALLQIAWKKP